MTDSNWTLRWHRSAREAYGHDIEFRDRDPDTLVGVIVALGSAFILGLLAGGAL